MFNGSVLRGILADWFGDKGSTVNQIAADIAIPLDNNNKANRVEDLELVQVPFKTQLAYKNDTSNVTVSPTTNNPDGSGWCLLFDVKSGAANVNRSCGIGFEFVGSTLGLRFSKPLKDTVAIKIDGVIYPIKNHLHVNDNLQNYSYSDNEATYIVATNLPTFDEDGIPIIHEAILVIAQDATTEQWFNLYGYLVEKRMGYKEKPRNSFASVPDAITVPNSYTSISSGNESFGGKIIEKVTYLNTDSSPQFVMIQHSTSNGTMTDSAFIYLAAAGSDGCSKSYEFSKNGIVNSSTINHKASIASKINYSVTYKL